MASFKYETYRQDVWNDDEEPEGDDWEPFAATAVAEHNGIRESLGGGIEVFGEIVWWRRKIELPEEN